MYGGARDVTGVTQVLMECVKMISFTPQPDWRVFRRGGRGFMPFR